MTSHSRAPNRVVVMGSAVGLTFNQVRPFLATLRNSGYSDHVVLLVDSRLRRRLRREPVATGVRLLRVRSLLPLTFRRVAHSRTLWALWRPVQTAVWACAKGAGRVPLPLRAGRRLQLALAGMVCTPMEARFLHYRRFLERHSYERVLLTDVRDVVFQSDPSGDIPPDGLAVSIETRRYTIASEPLNHMWVSDTFGPELLERIAARPVSCVGVTCGRLDAVSHYLRLMTREILRLSTAAARNGGSDTAIHNVLVWTNQLADVRTFDTLASPVATLNGVNGEELTLSPSGRLLNSDGSEPSIVHQYDRIPGLGPALLCALSGENCSPEPVGLGYTTAP
jgi:hypothetical protein